MGQVACTEREFRCQRRPTGNFDVARCVLWEFWSGNGSLKRWCLQGLGQDLNFLFSCSADAPVVSGSCTPHFDPFFESPVWRSTHAHAHVDARPVAHRKETRKKKSLETAAANAARAISKEVRPTARTHARTRAHWRTRTLSLTLR